MWSTASPQHAAQQIPSHANMFGGSPFNRLSWLRPSHTFLNAIITLDATKWLLFNSGRPLTFINSFGMTQLAFLSTEDVKSLLGPEPYFGQGKELGEILPDPVSSSNHSPLGAARHHGKPVIFLGLLNRECTSLPLIEDVLKEPILVASQIEGAPYFSMDISDLDLPPEELDQILKSTELARTGTEFVWAEPRGLSVALNMEEGAIFAVARSMVEWSSKRKFCPACGSKTYSMWGGWKVSCTSLLPWVDNTGRKLCPTVKGLHNFTHPRTDAVVIMVAVDQASDKILLGRGRKFHGRFYSALAGFIEPGETFEDAVKREMWEEAGVKVWDIRYHSTQPWPYPANLMVGFYARADSKQPIRTDLDNELVDARWFTREEILAILRGATGVLLTEADYRKFTDRPAGRDKESLNTTSRPLAPAENPPPIPKVVHDETQDPIRVPPTTAIAGVLIRHWAEGNTSPFSRDGGSTVQISVL